MDARLAREAAIKDTLSLSTRAIRSQTWYEWFWSIPAPSNPQTPEDALQNPALRAHFLEMLDVVEPPGSFRPTEVTGMLTDEQLASMGYEKQEEAIPAVYMLAWELRAFGVCEILRKGKVLGEDVTLRDIDGPVRIRRLAG